MLCRVDININTGWSYFNAVDNGWLSMLHKATDVIPHVDKWMRILWQIISIYTFQ